MGGEREIKRGGRGVTGFCSYWSRRDRRDAALDRGANTSRKDRWVSGVKCDRTDIYKTLSQIKIQCFLAPAPLSVYHTVMINSPLSMQSSA